MRVLWISLLLVGSITCVPLYPGGSQDPIDKPAAQSGYSTSGFSSFQPTSRFSSYGTLSQPSFSSFSSFQPAAGSGSQQGSQSVSPGGHQQSAQGGWGSSSDGGDKEPDFTHVSPGDQVYARKFLSHYRKSNYKLAQQFYTETEPVEPQEPIFPHHGKTSGHSKGQVQKGF